MSTKLVFSVLALAAATAAIHPALAWADGPAAAYGNDAPEASLDAGEQRIAGDDDSRARQRDLSDAYHNGYTARAKEDAEAYAALREQLKHPPKQVASEKASLAPAARVRSDIGMEGTPPLPPSMADDQDGVQVASVQTPRVQPRALSAQPQPSQYVQPPQAPQYPAQYTQYPQQYPQAIQAYRQPAYQQQYADLDPAQDPPPVYVQQPAYRSQPSYSNATAPVVQYVPVYGQPAYVARPPVQAATRPVVTAAAAVPYGVYGQAYYAPGYERPRVVARPIPRPRYAYPVQQAAYPGWD